MIRSFFFVALLFAVVVIPASAQVPDSEYWKYMRTITPEGYVCSRTAGPIKIDGRMDEQSWKAAPWTNTFVDIEGARKPIPRFKTRAKMLWDNTYFYVAAELEEPHVWGTILFRDQIVAFENDFEIFIDPNSDSHEYYEIELAPMNVLWDLYLITAYKDMTGGMAPNHAWNINGMKSEVWVNGTINDPRDIDQGWSVEFAIPWSELAQKAHRPSPPKNGDVWRVNFSRVEYTLDIVTSDRTTPDVKNNAYKLREGIPCDNWVWSPQGVPNMHCPEMFGYVQFSTALPGKDTYRPDPLIEGRRALHDIYYAQRDFRDKNKNWAGSLAELNLDFTGNTALMGNPVIEPTSNGYIARLTVVLPGGKSKKMSIRQDARIEVAE